MLEKKRLDGAALLPFAFDALYSDANRRTGATVLFFDVCSLSEARALVLSNTCAELVMLHGLKAMK